NTKLMGAGPRKSVLAYKSTWSPTSAVPFLQTADSASATTYAGFFTMYIRTQPFANDFQYFARWRAGKASMTVMLHPEPQFMCNCSGASGGCPAATFKNQPRK